ncbi:MAG: bifunctional UDP-N-acetylglucosamine diphosphorylase/glucosamine-1-phosphate N-acetyltransferase GlmU [Alphaproteobacteria bacterium]|nr:bifunctional UDP-N-acetylglucosamine diphosphorylase/glucosamine-1-phosphate N-acetyltransferase GlmU [Alphaproteobacteria bacterium]
MVDQRLAIVVLAAGLGTRMKSDLPKVLHKVGGMPMIGHVLAALGELGAGKVIVVVGSEMADRPIDFAPAEVAVQSERRGTADAVRSALPCLESFDGDVLVAYGDTPLVSPETYAALLAAKRGSDGAAVAVLGFRPADATDYGRLITGEDGALQAIVETRDASAEERKIALCNSGLMVVDGRHLATLLAAIGDDNAKGEFYLTDIVKVARAAGHGCVYIESSDANELMGINARADLAVAEAVFQTRARAQALAAGVTMVDPTTCYLSYDTRLGRDVVIEPHVFIGPGVVIGDRVTVRAFCHIEGAAIGDDASIGPFARIRPGSELGNGVRIGNFVEIKNAQFGADAKANHLSYVGDSAVGNGANIGAGTITCNYDGVGKHRTEIGAGAFIGSNTALVAPVRIGAGAVIGAGSVISEDVEAEAVAATRAPIRQVAGGAPKLRERNAARAGAERPEKEK